MVNILSVGNELYTVLSRVYNQEYLLLTELPNAITVFDCNYEMQYSPSYTGNIVISSSIDYQFCMPFGNAIQILLSQDYRMFLMTVQCNTVAIFLTSNGQFKIFDSHSRDPYGFPHAMGTCVLLTIESLEKLINYIETMYSDHDIASLSYELRGVNIFDQTELNNCSCHTTKC